MSLSKDEMNKGPVRLIVDAPSSSFDKLRMRMATSAGRGCRQDQEEAGGTLILRLAIALEGPHRRRSSVPIHGLLSPGAHIQG
jgi:hypothetical protein